MHIFVITPTHGFAMFIGFLNAINSKIFKANKMHFILCSIFLDISFIFQCIIGVEVLDDVPGSS